MSSLEKISNVLAIISAIFMVFSGIQWCMILGILLLDIVAILIAIMHVKKFKVLPVEGIVLLLILLVASNIAVFIKLFIKNEVILFIHCIVSLSVFVIYGLVKKTYKM